MMTRNLILIPIIFLSFFTLVAQVGIRNSSPQTNLDVVGENHLTTQAVAPNDGVLVPRVTDLILGGNFDGQLVYLINDVGTQKKGFYNWNGSAWIPILGTSVTSSSQNITQPDASIIGAATTPTAFSISPGTPIVDYTAYSNNIVVSGITGNTSLVEFTINITHTWDGDLDIFLVAPTGEILDLCSNNGGSGDDFINTTFSDSAASNITTGVAPFTGSYRPEGSLVSSGPPMDLTATITSLAGFNGLDPNGTWVVRLQDDLGLDSGVFVSATLTISGSTPPVWELIGEASIIYNEGRAIIVKSTYSGDPTDLNGVITSLTRDLTSAGVTGTTASALPGAILNYASDSPSGTGNYWVNTMNQTRDVGLTANTVYYYQLWRKGNIESPAASNETFSLIPFSIQE